jgi:hypothetical protein
MTKSKGFAMSGDEMVGKGFVGQAAVAKVAKVSDITEKDKITSYETLHQTIQMPPEEGKPYIVNIPLREGNFPLQLYRGKSIVVMGANGAGKTRLGAYIDANVSPLRSHRVPAQKSLSLAENINLIGFERARRSWLVGHPEENAGSKAGNRFNGNPEIIPISDFDTLLQTLFAQHNRIASEFYQQGMGGKTSAPKKSDILILKDIWDKLLPHRKLIIREANIEVEDPQGGVPYKGSNLSDGERSIFYYLGQCLSVPPEYLIIVDEPESHIHKAILSDLWDSIEAVRPDCAFVYITHDLDFATNRKLSDKYFLRSFKASPIQWDIEKQPADTGIAEIVLNEIVGSRKPILFIEGEKHSLDSEIYVVMYPDFKIFPMGSCENVIRSASAYNNTGSLHRYSVSGIVDRDGLEEGDEDYLKKRNIHVSSVNEIENIFALPKIFKALADHFIPEKADEANKLLADYVLSMAASNIEENCARHAARSVDRKISKLIGAKKTIDELEKAYSSGLSEINIRKIFSVYEEKMKTSLAKGDLTSLLAIYENKAILKEVCRLLGFSSKKEFLVNLRKVLKDEISPIWAALREVLPKLEKTKPV